MKVLVISAAYPPMHAGEATNAYHLCSRLAERGAEVHVLTSESNKGFNQSGIHVHAIMSGWAWRDMLSLRSFLRRCEPDAVFLMYLGLMYDYHPMITFAPTLSKKLFPQVPFVTRYESAFVGANPEKTPLFARALRKYIVQRWAGAEGVAYSSGTLLRDSDYVITLSERHRDMVVEEWPPVSRKIVIIPPPPNIRIVDNRDGVARERGRRMLGLDAKEVVLAFLGYLYPVKGIEALLRAFRLVVEKRKNVKLVFIGGKIALNIEGGATYYDQMQRLAQELGINDHVMWTGTFKPESEDGSLLLHAADIGILPFIQGVQLNNSSFSSMAAHGLPMIVTLGPLSDKVFRHGDNVLSCSPGDHVAMATLIMELIENLTLRQRLQTGIQQLANECFSWEKAINLTMTTLSGHNT